jgi:hypothetical protein
MLNIEILLFFNFNKKKSTISERTPPHPYLFVLTNNLRKEIFMGIFFFEPVDMEMRLND